MKKEEWYRSDYKDGDTNVLMLSKENITILPVYQQIKYQRVYVLDADEYDAQDLTDDSLRNLYYAKSEQVRKLQEENEALKEQLKLKSLRVNAQSHQIETLEEEVAYKTKLMGGADKSYLKHLVEREKLQAEIENLNKVNRALCQTHKENLSVIKKLEEENKKLKEENEKLKECRNYYMNKYADLYKEQLTPEELKIVRKLINDYEWSLL